MFNDKEKNRILNNLNEIITKTSKNAVNSKDVMKSKFVNDQYINMQTLLEYYDKKYEKMNLQNSLSENILDLAYDKLTNELEHKREDDKQKDEGNDILSEETQKKVQEEINKSKMPANSIDKEGILEELSEMAEDEENVTEKDVENFVKAATIKAIYEATLERYEKNREQIQNHAQMQNYKYGDFALEDRLALENRQYEVYLQKLSVKYKQINPSHKTLEESKKIPEKQKDIRDQHNKEEELKEEERKKEILEITLLYREKEDYIEEMAFMSANPDRFNPERFKELQTELRRVDKNLCMRKSSPAVLLENIQRDDKQEEKYEKEVGKNGGVAKTSTENEKKEEKNNNTIEEETKENIENTTNNAKDVVEKYWECREKGDIEGTKVQYQILKTMSGSKDVIKENMKDIADDGKEEYKTPDEKNNELNEKLNLKAVNNDDEIYELEAMDEDVKNISGNLKTNDEKIYNTSEKSIDDDDVKQHTIGGSKRPY